MNYSTFLAALLVGGAALAGSASALVPPVVDICAQPVHADCEDDVCVVWGSAPPLCEQLFHPECTLATDHWCVDPNGPCFVSYDGKCTVEPTPSGEGDYPCYAFAGHDDHAVLCVWREDCDVALYQPGRDECLHRGD